jgi:hypothetical protein
MVGRILRFIVVVLLGFLTVGFGVCGAMGTLIGGASLGQGSTGKNEGEFMLVLGLAGVAIAALCYWGFRRLQRPASGGGRAARPRR